MGVLAARLFTRLQAAGFYQALLCDSLALLGDGDGRTLLDIGCGPGGLARVAAARGYHATGIDSDPAMIAQARRIARRKNSSATFVLANLNEAPGRFPSADVVVAASLLAVVPDPVAALAQIWGYVLSGGALLIIEPSDQMTPANAQRLLHNGLVGSGGHLLTLWASAREGRTVDSRILDTLPGCARRHDHSMLDGMIRATVIEQARS